MDSAIMNEILEELSSALQRAEAQSTAILEFVKEKGIAKEDELAPYLERAGEASSVRWRATRVRLERLLSGLEKSEQQSKEETKEKEEHKEKPERKEEPAQKAKSQQDAPEKTRGPNKPAKDEKSQQPMTIQKPEPVEDQQSHPQPPQTAQTPEGEQGDAPNSPAEKQPRGQANRSDAA